MVGNALQQANVAGRSAFNGLFAGLRNTVSGFSSILKSSIVNAVGALGIAQSFRSAFQQLDKVGDLSQRFGVSTDALQRLGGVAELSGSSMDSMARALSKLGRTVSEAVLDPTSQAAEKFGQLGISAADLKGKGIDEVFMMVAQRISELSSETEQGAAAFDIFGKAGEDIRNVLQLGNKEIERLSNGVAAASQEAVAAAQSMDDAFKSFGQSITQTVGELLVVLNPLVNLFLKIANVATSGLGIIAAGATGLFTGDFSPLRNAMLNRDKAVDSLLSDPLGTKAAAAKSESTSSSRSLEPIRTRSLKKSESGDGKESIMQNMQNIISSNRGIERGQIIADSLARIGGGGASVLVGGSDREQQRLLQEQLKALKKIESNTSVTEAARLK